jgi:hypothetical protein
MGRPCGFPSLLRKERYGLTTFRPSTLDEVGSACSPVAQHLRAVMQEHGHWPRTFWFKPGSPLGLVDLTTFIGSSLVLAMSSHPCSRPPWGWQSCPASHEARTTWLVRLRCPKSFTPPGCPGRMSW